MKPMSVARTKGFMRFIGSVMSIPFQNFGQGGLVPFSWSGQQAKPPTKGLERNFGLATATVGFPMHALISI
jgi:hypothetical protein